MNWFIKYFTCDWITATIYLVMKQINDDQIWHKINIMINVVSRLNIMEKHCMCHRMKSMVQFDIIENIKNDYLKENKYRIIIVLDHNHKFLGMKFCEEQVKYFSKRAWESLVQWRSCERTAVMGHSHRDFTISLLTML